MIRKICTPCKFTKLFSTIKWNISFHLLCFDLIHYNVYLDYYVTYIFQINIDIIVLDWTFLTTHNCSFWFIWSVMHRTHKIKKRYCLLWANDFSIIIEPTEYDIVNHFVRHNGSVAQWITRLTTNQEIAGLTPARVDEYFNFTVHGKNITHSWFGIIISLKLTFKYSTFDLF